MLHSRFISGGYFCVTQIIFSAARAVHLTMDRRGATTYSVGKTELLEWINSSLCLNLQKIEQVASGCVVIQLMDKLHAGVVPMSKVNFEARNEYEFVDNYKILQRVFDKLNVSKTIEVSKLCKARPLDNLEFMQWFKTYYDGVALYGLPEYDPIARRAVAKGGTKFFPGAGAGNSSSAAAERRPSTGSGSRPSSARTPVRKNSATAGRPASGSVSDEPSQATLRKTSISQAEIAQAELIAAENAALSEKITGLKVEMEGVEKERDFYFSKLRDVETLCQEECFANIPVMQAIQQILYSEDPELDSVRIAEDAIEATRRHMEQMQTK